MDWQNDEFENLLRRFRLREPRPLAPEQPAGIRTYRVKIAAAAALVFAIGASAAIVRQLVVKEDIAAVVDQPQEVAGPDAVGDPGTGTAAATAAPVPSVPQPKTPPIKLDPKAQDPVLQLTMIVPAPLQDAGPLSEQDSPQQGGGEQDKGHRAFLAACGSCHAVNLVENTNLETRHEYVTMVDRMVAIGAAVSSQEASAIVDYIFKTYGRKPASADDRGKSVFNTACGSCHAPDVMDGRKEADRETYQAIVDRMIGYGAAVPPDQVDPLVDYLFKTYARKKN